MTPSEVVTAAAAIYPSVLDTLIPSAWHHVEQYANNPIEADHANSNTGYIWPGSWPTRPSMSQRWPTRQAQHRHHQPAPEQSCGWLACSTATNG
jgi:hypothetical protein